MDVTLKTTYHLKESFMQTTITGNIYEKAEQKFGFRFACELFQAVTSKDPRAVEMTAKVISNTAAA